MFHRPLFYPSYWRKKSLCDCTSCFKKKLVSLDLQWKHCFSSDASLQVITEKIGSESWAKKVLDTSRISDSWKAPEAFLSCFWRLFSKFALYFFRFAMFFEKPSCGTCRSVIPALKESREAQLILNFPYVATQFWPRLQGSILPVRPQPQSFYV